MFGFLKKRKLEEAETLLSRHLFISKVEEMRRNAGFPGARLPLENLVLFFAMNLADIVFQNAKNTSTPEASTDAVEKAAMLIVFAQAAHTGARIVGIMDKEMRSLLMTNGMANLLQADLDNPSAEALAEISLATIAYQSISDDRLGILRDIDALSNGYLVTQSEESLCGLVVCWRQIVEFIRGNQREETNSA